jgi:hypothetical protein
MVLMLDAGALYAQADANDPDHAAVAAVLRADRGPFVTSQTVAAEADYLILSRLGVDVGLAFLEDLAEGTFSAECLTRAEITEARAVAAQYRDLAVGLADASLVVLARRLKTRRILTLDERCFRVIRPLQGGHFTLLPADG